MTTKFSVDDHRHYLFTPRELTKWIMGLFYYDLGKEELLDVFAYEVSLLYPFPSCIDITNRTLDLNILRSL